jgi:spermidine synthase
VGSRVKRAGSVKKGRGTSRNRRRRERDDTSGPGEAPGEQPKLSVTNPARHKRRRAIGIKPPKGSGSGAEPRVRSDLLPGGVERGRRLRVRANRRFILRTRSEFQRIQLVRQGGFTVLYLDQHIQFHSFDEHRYHEGIATFPMLHTPEGSVRSALIMGGGDGMAARELLRFPEVQRVVNVELDPEMTALARRPPVSDLNEGSFLDPRVELVHDDARAWLARSNERFDLVIADFPDPTAPILATLYTTELYRRVKSLLRPGGLLVVQTLYLPLVYTCIRANLAAVFKEVQPYRVPMTSMVFSGFHLCGDRPLKQRRPIPEWTKFLNEGSVAAVRAFAEDEQHYLLQKPPVADIYRACLAAVKEDERLYSTIRYGLAANAS